MSVLKGFYNPHFVVTVVSAYLCHVYKFKIVGFLVDYEVNFSSTIIVLAFAILLGEYKTWPCTLRRPPLPFLLLYEVLMVTLLTNVARTLIWMPAVVTLREYLPIVSKKVLHLNQVLKLRKYGMLFKFARWLESDCGLHDLSKLLAVGIFTWVLYATDSMEHINEVIRKFERKVRRRMCVTICEPPKRISCPSSRSADGTLGDLIDSPIATHVIASGDSINLTGDSLDSDNEDVTPSLPNTSVDS